MATQAGASELATGRAARLAATSAELEGVAYGDPALVPGARVALAGAGPTFDGTYRLTRTRHVLDAGGYRVHLESSPAAERTLLGLTGGGTGAPATASGNRAVPGVVVGVVTDVKDPDKVGRVKVKYPWMSDDYATDWLRVALPGAGPDRGAAVLPEVNDEVVVGFDHGDPSVGYVLGGLWSSRSRPPRAATLVDGSGKVATRVLASRTGHALVLDDGPQGGVLVTTGDGQLSVRLAKVGTTITVSSKGKVEITGSTDVTVQAGTKLTLTGGTEVALSAPRVTIAGTAQVAVTGGLIRLN